MTRRDYILIAKALKCTRPTLGIVSYERMNQWIGIAQTVAEVLRNDNPKFDREHFLAVVRGEKDLNSRPTQKFNPSRRPYNTLDLNNYKLRGNLTALIGE